MDDWDAQKMLDMYIHDYMVRNNMHTTAQVFAQEANFSPKTVAINPPDGFLTEWWSLFWDVYSADTKKNSEEDELLFSKAKHIFGSMASGVPDMPRPDVNYVMQNVCPAMYMPEVPNMLQTVSPSLMPRPDIGSLLQSSFTTTIPMLEQNPSRSGMLPISDFSIRQGPSMSSYLASRMHEQEHLRLPDSVLNFNSQHLEIDRLAAMIPSSSNPRHPQTKVCINRQLSITRNDNSGTGYRRSVHVPAEPTPHETRALQINSEPADTGSSMSSNSASNEPSSEELEDTSSEMDI